MRLYEVVSGPSAGFQVQWQRARGVQSLHVLNATAYFVAIAGDDGTTIDILAPWTRAEIWLEHIGYSYVTFSDAGLGTVPASSGVTGNTIWAGATNARVDTRHFPLETGQANTTLAGSNVPKAPPVVYENDNVVVAASASVKFGNGWVSTVGAIGWDPTGYSTVEYMVNSGANWSGTVEIDWNDHVGDAFWAAATSTTVNAAVFGVASAAPLNKLFNLKVTNTGGASATLNNRLILWP